MKHFKTGRWSKEEIQFITDNHKAMTIKELSEHLDRPPSKIEELVGELHVPEDVRQMELNIKRTHEWKQISKQLDDDEQETFLYHWREIINQFKSDITHTERLQIMDAIRIEILMNRVLLRMRYAQQLIEDMQKELKVEMEKDASTRDIVRVNILRQDITANFVGIGNFQKENQILMERKQNILKDMKATREQRKKRIEESKETLKEWVAMLVSDNEKRRNLGIQIEKFRHAVNVEYERLSEYYQFADGKVDQPVLNSENILEDNV